MQHIEGYSCIAMHWKDFLFNSFLFGRAHFHVPYFPTLFLLLWAKECLGASERNKCFSPSTLTGHSNSLVWKYTEKSNKCNIVIISQQFPILPICPVWHIFNSWRYKEAHKQPAFICLNYLTSLTVIQLFSNTVLKGSLVFDNKIYLKKWNRRVLLLIGSYSSPRQ